jgi:signal transduction histidine kinase
MAIRTGTLRRNARTCCRKPSARPRNCRRSRKSCAWRTKSSWHRARSCANRRTRLECQQAELEQTNAQLEEHAHKLGIQHDQLADAKLDLEHKAAELIRANRYKSEFLANMSHELRTPLNSSLILAKTTGRQSRRESHTRADQVRARHHLGGNDLLALINDILDSLEDRGAQGRDHARQRRSIRVINRLAQTFEPVAQEKQILFRVTLGEGLPSTITTDAQRLAQILRNLLSNAMKFTERGEVTLAVSPHGTRARTRMRH